MALPVRDFIVQRLLEYDPTYDVGSGVPTTSLMIDPQSVILQPVIDELTVVQASSSILTILESSDPDTFPEDIVDGLASNAFVERIPGAIGSDVERLRFFQPQVFAAKKGLLIFRGPTGQRYSNSEAVNVTAAEMALNQEGTLYYVDVPIIALEEGEDFNTGKGSITSMEAEPAGVANVTNLFGINQGRNRETNTELIDRIKVAVTVRALVTGRGIIVTLTENFTTIEEIEPIGFGDPEMMRDIVYNVHIGGNVDVYIKTAALSSGFKDFFGIEVDTSRRRSTTTTAVLLVEDVGYSLGHPVDRTSVDPVVRSIDGVVTFAEGADYEIDDVTGLISRPPLSGVVHVTGAGAEVVGAKIFESTGDFVTARAGMILTIDVPSTVAGTYTIKQKIDNDTVEIYGSFPISSETGVDFQMDDNLSIAYEYNPVTVDVIKEARDEDRTDFTITDVPLMYIDSIEVLDPLSGEPTGDVLNGVGGYGAGGYGGGGYGVGSSPTYQFIVTQPTLRHSEREDNYIEFDESQAAASLRVNYKYASAIPPIQAFMDDRNNQSETASLVARHFIPVYIDAPAAIQYNISTSTQSSALTADEMLELVMSYINDVDEGNPLEISDLVDVLYDNGAIFVDLGAIGRIKGEIHNHDGSIVFASPDDTGAIRIPDDEIPDPTDKPLSPRIARFIARDITLTRTLA